MTRNNPLSTKNETELPKCSKTLHFAAGRSTIGCLTEAKKRRIKHRKLPAFGGTLADCILPSPDFDPISPRSPLYLWQTRCSLSLPGGALWRGVHERSEDCE